MTALTANRQISLDPAFTLWTPPPGRTIAVGAERQPLALPTVPLPIRREDWNNGEPDDDAIGRGVYDYLRQFPDCPDNAVYARLLRDACPHYIADLGAQIVMLDRKEVDTPYLVRKLTSMKILALLEPDNPGLLQQLGKACFELALSLSELPRCRRHLLAALGYFQRSLTHLPDHPTSFNYLGQIDFLLGDYPAAARRWQGVSDRLEDAGLRQDFAARIERVRIGDVPDHPLIDDLEAVGAAMELCGSGSYQEARELLDRLEEEGTLLAEFPFAEFYFLLGTCRARTGDPGGAFAAFEQALEINPDYGPALEGKRRIVES